MKGLFTDKDYIFQVLEQSCTALTITTTFQHLARHAKKKPIYYLLYWAQKQTKQNKKSCNSTVIKDQEENALLSWLGSTALSHLISSRLSFQNKRSQSSFAWWKPLFSQLLRCDDDGNPQLCSALSGVETQPHTTVTPGMLVGKDSKDNVKVSG